MGVGLKFWKGGEVVIVKFFISRGGRVVAWYYLTPKYSRLSATSPPSPSGFLFFINSLI